ncbi:MAG: hypothetical protein AAF573_20495 [Bacteroidota bacterium]
MKNLIILLFYLCFLLIACKNAKTPDGNKNSSSMKSSSSAIHQSEKPQQQVSSSAFNFSKEAKGCESFTVFRLSEDETRAIMVTAEMTDLKLSKSPQTFVIGKDKIYANVYLFDGSAKHFFCDDIADDDPSILQKWKATEGNIRGWITEEKKPNEIPQTYKITLQLDFAKFQDDSKNVIELKGISFDNVLVGTFSG